VLSYLIESVELLDRVLSYLLESVELPESVESVELPDRYKLPDREC
jgi:hypothetical protein